MAAFEYLAAYTTFDNVAEMDAAVEHHIQQHYYQLTDSERAIVYKLASRSLMYPGASHLLASTIADLVGVSTKTVYRSVKKLAKFGIIEKVAGTKKNGIKGASFYKILPFVDNVPSSVSQRTTTDDASDINVCEQVSENQSLKSFNLLDLKTSSLYDVYNNAHAEKDACKEYMNEWQVMLYDFMHSMPFTDRFKDELHKLVLASEIDSMQAFHKAKNIMLKIAMDIKDGVLTVASTLRAVFVGAYSKSIERGNSSKMSNLPSIEDELANERPVPFYDWLRERDNHTNYI